MDGPWVDSLGYVCLSVCPSVCLSVRLYNLRVMRWGDPVMAQWTVHGLVHSVMRVVPYRIAFWEKVILELQNKFL